MTNLAFYSSFAFTFFAAVFIFLLSKRRLKVKGASVKSTKNIFTVSTLFSGLACGIFVFSGLVELFRLFGYEASYGHGEVLIAAPMFNFIFACVLVILGRIALTETPTTS